MDARDLFYKKGHEFSNAEDRAYAREQFIYNITEDLLVLLEDLKEAFDSLMKKGKKDVDEI